MKKQGLIKKIGVPALILAVIVAGYFLFIKGDVSFEAPIPLDPEVLRVEREVLSLLNDLNRIDLEGNIFSSPIFHSLVDYSVELTPEPVGRENPFAPLDESSEDTQQQGP